MVTGSDGPGGDVGALGEFALIRAVAARLPQTAQVHLGPGDDAAVVAAPDGRVVATTDVLVEGRHFRTDWSSARDVGHKAAAANLADVAAMGARPTALLVGLAMPPETPVVWALGLAEGLGDECAPLGASVVGGDVVASPVLTVAVTALGSLDGREPVTRSGARAGDVVAVAGRLGWSAAGLAVLSAQAQGHDDVVEAHRRPRPPYAQGPQAALAGVHAMCDVSDGLLADLGHVAESSGVAVDLDLAALAPDPPLLAAAATTGDDARSWVLTGGEDHALVACFPSGAVPPGWRQVGVVNAGSGVTVGGVPWPGAAGFDHFASAASEARGDPPRGYHPATWQPPRPAS